MVYDGIPAFTLQPTQRQAPAKLHVEEPPSKTPRFIEDVTTGKVQLPVIPAIVQQLMNAMRDPNVDARKIATLLARDPVLTSKVLRLANSSFFGGQRSMASVDAAISMVGMAALNRLIVACGVSSTFGQVPGLDLDLFWRDARVAANAAHKLAGGVQADADQAYLCGLLHATGHLILCRSYPDMASAMFDGFERLRSAELAAIEVQAFGIDHSAVGAYWVESIKFPAEVAAAIGNSLRPPEAMNSGLDLALNGACTLAAAVAKKVSADEALAALHPLIHKAQADANGAPKPSFVKLYDSLFEAEPAG